MEIKVEFTVAEVMDMCDVSKRLVLDWIEDGKFPGAHFLWGSPKMGYLIPAEELIAHAEKGNPMLVPIITKRAKEKEQELIAAAS